MSGVMYGGGLTINKQTAHIIRVAGLLVPLVLLVYGLLVQYDFLPSQHYLSDNIFYAIIIPFVIIGVGQFLFPSRSRLEAGVRLGLYHVAGALYFIFVTGFSTPLVVGWMMLFVGSYAYFSTVGIQVSILVFIAAAVADAFIHSQPATVMADLLTLVIVMVVGLATIAIGRIQEVNGAELTRSKEQELLQRDRILTIVNNLADAVLSTDQDGIVKVYNAASLNLLDTNASLNGTHIDEVVTLQDQNGKRVKLSSIFKKARGVVVRDDLTMTQDDETLRLEVTCSPIRGNFTKADKRQNNDGYILILRDVTKAKSLEEERDEFISVVSHELRTPITIAEGTISNVQLMMERPDIAPSILKDGVNTAHEQVIFLARMVNDLSTLSRAERGVADTPEPIDVRSMVDDLYGEYAPQAEKKGLHFDLDLATHLGQVTASRLYLKELLQNFITNSIKYTKEGSVTLKVARSGSKITFEVKDTGIGISKTDQAKIFNKFYRSEDYRTRETGGTGLGLYVAKKLAKKLGTEITLSSRLNHGSAFSFSLRADDK